MIECDICCFEFGEDRVPKILSKCGHSFCDQCIESLKKFAVVECPHCRVQTDIGDIRTNFALSNLCVSSSISCVGANSSNSVCVGHLKPVKLFCSHCRIFICEECFSLIGSEHASHARMSIEDGEKFVQGEVEGLSVTVARLKQVHSDKLARESEQYKSVCVEVENQRRNVLRQYDELVARIQSEMTMALSSLDEVMRFSESLYKDELHVDSILNRIDQILHSPLEEFMAHSQHIKEWMNLVDEGCIMGKMGDEFSISSSIRKPAKILEIPQIYFSKQKEPYVYVHISNPPAQVIVVGISSLHRSTSNDQLQTDR